MRLVSDNIFHFRRFLKKHKLNLELTLKKLSATQASIQSFPGEEEDRTENIAVEIQPIIWFVNHGSSFADYSGKKGYGQSKFLMTKLIHLIRKCWQ